LLVSKRVFQRLQHSETPQRVLGLRGSGHVLGDAGMHRVMIHPAEYDDCLRAVERAFELFPLDIRGKKIMVKPNALTSAAPEEGATTHPSVLRAVIDRLERSRPAQIIVGDNTGVRHYGANEETFRKCGLLDAAIPGSLEIMESQLRLRPRAVGALCTGCGTCIEACPASALSMAKGIPEVDPDRCIVCFCCQEKCPERAIQLC